MTSLRMSRFLLLNLVVFVTCASSPYKIDSQAEGRTQLLANPNRITLECYRLTDYKGDDDGSQFISLEFIRLMVKKTSHLH